MAGGSIGDPAGRTGGANPLDQVGDLDLVMSDLAGREERLREEYEKNQRLIGSTHDAVEQAVGTGKAEQGRVRARADASGHVVEVHLEPEALRMGSIGRLEAAIADACNAAVDDAARRLGDAVADPMKDFFDSMPEVTTLLGADSYQAYVDPVLPASPDTPPPPRPTGGPRESKSPYE